MKNTAKLALSAFALIAALTARAPDAIAQEAGWPRSIRHEAGELTVKAKPQRIVSTTPSVTGVLLAIGAPVIASAATTPSILTDKKGFFAQWAEVADERGVKVLYNNLKFDIEAILGLNPDLLVASTTGADSVVQHYAELTAQDVPTIAVNYSNRSWQELAIILGKAIGREAEAEATIKRFDAYATEVAKTLTPSKGPVSVVAYNLGGTYSISRASSPQAQIVAALGFTVSGLPEELRSQVTRSSDFDFFARENLSRAISGESVFLMRGTEADVQAFLADPLLANHPAVVNRRVYALGPTSFRIDYYSGRQMLDAIARAFRKP